MTFQEVILDIATVAGVSIGWWLASRRPWHGKLGTWKLDPAIRYAKRKHGYWPLPDKWVYGWRRPLHRSYCLRCGKCPFYGPELMYSKTSGITFICYQCAQEHVTTPEELTRYAHQVVDMNICRNFDPKITHPDHALPISHYEEMWKGILVSLKDLVDRRG